jgi:hypothetical protein
MKADVTYRDISEDLIGLGLRSIPNFCVDGDEYSGRSAGTFLKSWPTVSFSLEISVKYCGWGHSVEF